jgi:hypothetical protein
MEIRMRHNTVKAPGLTRLFAIMIEMIREQFGRKPSTSERFSQLSLF